MLIVTRGYGTGATIALVTLRGYHSGSSRSYAVPQVTLRPWVEVTVVSLDARLQARVTLRPTS